MMCGYFIKDVDISDITLQETEVVDVKWVTDEELIKMERKGSCTHYLR